MQPQGIKQNHATASRSGATSIYVVVIAALLFTIITVSFIRILLRNASNSAANEMAQMAYDSALAGVEDAKTAIQKYRACLQSGSSTTACEDIKNAIKASYDYAANPDITADPTAACDSVKKVLTSDPSAEGETLIQETSDGHAVTNQAYTCVLLAETLKDYRSTLTESSPIRVIPLRPQPTAYDDDSRNAAAEGVKFVRIDWYSKENNSGSDTVSFDGYPYFQSASTTTVRPSLLSAQLIQTGKTFTLDEFKNSSGNASNRSLVYLTPNKNSSVVGGQILLSDTDIINKTTLANTNDHENLPKNSPQDAKCVEKFESNDFACAAVLEVPDTIGGNGRNWETFFLVLNLPYRTPETDFSVRMYSCKDGAKAGDESCLKEFSGVQVAVDSTGRANDLYSRVEARIEFTDINFPFPQYALQATSNDPDAINKNFYITQDCGKNKREADGTLKWESCPNSGPADS